MDQNDFVEDLHGQLEKALARLARFRALFDNLDSGYSVQEAIYDANGRLIDFLGVEFNRAYEEKTGIAPWPGRRLSEFLKIETYWFEFYEEVLRTGSAQRLESYVSQQDTWFSVHASRVGDAGSKWVASVFENITARKKAEARLRESEERQAFLLKLADALRPLSDPLAIQQTAMQVLGVHMRVNRAFYGEAQADHDTLAIGPGYCHGALPIEGQLRFSDFEADMTARYRAGKTFVVDDTQTDSRFSEVAKAQFRAIEVGSAIGAPLVKEGAVRAIVSLHDVSARTWTAHEIELLEEVAQRTWAAVEQARAEAALRGSEERFRQFAKASASGLWIRRADTLAMEFVSPALSAIYGAEPDAFLGDISRWAALIVPEDRDAALRRLERARQGEPTVHEFRIRRASDQAFRWIRNTDFPLLGSDGGVERIGGIAEDVTDAKIAVEHQGVLLAELQHRVRNIMGVIRSMANRTAATARDVEDYRSHLEGRLLALARVQALLTREANAGGSLRDVIDAETRAQAEHGGQIELTGPEVRLSPKAVEVLTLAFHELSTNALKYGALSVPEGRLRVKWKVLEKRGAPWLALDWIEEGAPARPQPTSDKPRRIGFGSELIQSRIPYELRGSGRLTIDATGAKCHMEFPLEGGESILETDAPKLTTVFGGPLDMSGAPDLSGRKVLVVEDDYFMAADASAALRGAGAQALGPCRDEEAVRELLATETPTHAVLDLNLGGGGPKFEIARWLKARGVPFIFLTGYDPGVIPPELADVARLQKPVPFREIVEAIARI